MVDLTSASNEVEFIESVRAIFRAYLPESDAWQSPNFFSINATIVGGLAWSAFNEAQNGLDLRINPQTAVGEYLDIIGGQPPLFLTRYGPTKSTGSVSVNFPSVLSIPVGYVFTAANGVEYKVTAVTALTAGVGTVPVISTGTGALQNSLIGQPLIGAAGQAISLGLYGGNDGEDDESFRNRIFATQSKPTFFGSACSYENELKTITGVSRAWATEDGLVASIRFLMEKKYPCGVPLQADIDAVKAHFAQDCLTNMFFCPVFEPAVSLIISPEVTWGACPTDICEIEKAMQDWLRANYDISEGVTICEVENWLQQTYPEFDPKIKCCTDFPPVCGAVYNCVELVGG